MIKQLLTPKAVKIYNAYTEWLHEGFNFEDHSVGMYWTPELTESIIEDLEKSFDNGEQIVTWDESTLVIRDSSFDVVIAKVNIFGNNKWCVVEIS